MLNVARSYHAHDPTLSFETYAPGSSISLLDRADSYSKCNTVRQEKGDLG